MSTGRLNEVLVEKNAKTKDLSMSDALALNAKASDLERQAEDDRNAAPGVAAKKLHAAAALYRQTGYTDAAKRAETDAKQAEIEGRDFNCCKIF